MPVPMICMKFMETNNFQGFAGSHGQCGTVVLLFLADSYQNNKLLLQSVEGHHPPPPPPTQPELTTRKRELCRGDWSRFPPAYPHVLFVGTDDIGNRKWIISRHQSPLASTNMFALNIGRRFAVLILCTNILFAQPVSRSTTDSNFCFWAQPTPFFVSLDLMAGLYQPAMIRTDEPSLAARWP